MKSAGLAACAVALCVAAGSGNAAAAPPGIPAKYLDREARLLATMTPAERAQLASFMARLTPKTTVADVNAMTRGMNVGNVFVFMIEYLKMMEKEAREDRLLAQDAKVQKLQEEQSKIAKQRSEAQERYDRAMTEANLEIIFGATSAAAAAAGAHLLPTTTPTRASLPPAVRVR